MSTIQNADRILMLENGQIIAEGNHKQLLQNCKQYKELYDTEIKNQMIIDIKKVEFIYSTNSTGFSSNLPK